MTAHDIEKLLIRPAQPVDAPTLSTLALRSKAHWGYSGTFMRACARELCVTPAHIERLAFDYQVAECSSRIVAYCAVEHCGAETYELEALFVEPALIGHGIGQRLLQHACRRIAAAGGGILRIQSDPNAAPFYQALGARHLGERESDSVPGRFLPLFELDVAAPAERDTS